MLKTRKFRTIVIVVIFSPVLYNENITREYQNLPAKLCDYLKYFTDDLDPFLVSFETLLFVVIAHLVFADLTFSGSCDVIALLRTLRVAVSLSRA